MEKRNVMNRIRNAAGLCLILALFTGMAHDASAQEVTVLDLQTAMQIALTQSNDIIRQQNSYAQQQIRREETLARQKTVTTINWSLPSYNRRISESPSDFGIRYTDDPQITQDARLSIKQPFRWTNGTFSLSSIVSTTNSWAKSDNPYEVKRGEEADYGVPAGTVIRKKSDNVTHRWQDSFTLSYSQPLFQPNTQKFDWNQSMRDFDMAVREYDQTENSIWRIVLNDFYSLYQTKRRLEIARDDFENTEKNYQMAVNKYNAGILALVDQLTWQSNLMNAENSLYNQELNYKRDKDRFKRQIGLPLDQEIDLVAEIDVKFIEIDEQKAFEEAFARSISLDNARNSIVVQKHNIDVQEAASKVNASLQVSYGLNESVDFGEFWNKSFYNQGGNFSYESWTNNLFKNFKQLSTVSMNVNIPIWDSGQRKLRLQRSMLQVEQSERNIINSEDQLIVNIQNSLDAVQNARDRISLLAGSVQIAEMEYDINKQKFDLGEISSDQLTNSNNRLTQAKENVLGAQISYLLSLAGLYNQTFWDFENNCPLNETVGKFIER